MNQNKNILLKIALLSCAVVTASINAIAGNIPAIAESFSDVPVHIIELITTIPSLSMMIAILCSSLISGVIGNKRTVLIGLLLCGLGGVAPYIFQDIIIMMVTRLLFGFGVGLISSTLLIMIIYFFDGKTRSQMIGLQGSVGGLGSMICTYIAGQLLMFGWNVSFLTYLVSFIVFLIVFLYVPNVTDVQSSNEHSGSKICWSKIFLYAVLSFISVTLATFFVIKCSTLLILNEYGSVQDGSLLVMFISAGSLVSGAMYGNIYNKLKNKSLILFYLICAISFVIASASRSLLLTLLSAFILGYGYMAFVPFLQEKVGIYGNKGTTTLLVFQSLGSFIAPYFGAILSYFSDTLSHQFFIAGLSYIVLMLVAYIIKDFT